MNVDAKTRSAQASFAWNDPFLLDSQLSEEERMIRDAVSAYAQEKLLPRVRSAFREERFDREILNEAGEMGLLGIMTDPKYGGHGLGYVAYGLAAREIERVDSGYRSAMSVQSSLVMHPIFAFGTDAPIKAGFGVQAPEGKGCKVTFDHIAFKRETLQDLRNGS